MQSNYELYKTLSEELKNYLKKLSNENQNILDNLDKYVDIDKINYFNENGTILSTINDLVAQLDNNLELSNIGKEETLEGATENLNETIKEEIEKVEKVVSETQEFLDSSIVIEKDILDEQFENIINVTEKIMNMLQGVNINEEETNMINSIIQDKMNEEEKQIEAIKIETENIMSKNHKVIFEDDLLRNYCSFLKNELMKTQEVLFRLKNIYENNKAILTNSENISLSLLIDILEQEQDGLSLAYSQIESILTITITENVEEEVSLDEDEEEIKDEQSEIDNIVEVLKNEDLSQDDVVDKIVQIYNKQKKELDNARVKLEEQMYNYEIDNKEKDADTLKYKNYCSMLNKSFWEARYSASLDNIKYPSALYEKTVKEHQNDYLIENYNLSLSAVEEFIEDYKNKYADDIYMDEIYEQALVLLKDESTLSVKELCDESSGLSILDRKAYDLLEDDLNEVIKEIGLVKAEENIDESVDVAEYKKSLRISKLVDRKNIIEKQLFDLSKRAEKLENNE